MNFKERVKPTTTTRALLTAVPYILIQSQALHKMFQYVDGCADEIGWLGTAHREEREIIIDDVFLFEQDVHATTTEITPEGLSNFAMELMQQPNGVDVWNSMKVWGHSHVNMGVTPSGQDDLQMQTFQEGGHDWFIRLIANKKGELKIDLYDYQTGVIYLDLPWEALENEEETQIKEQIRALENALEDFRAQTVSIYAEPIKKEIAVKVRKKTYATQTHGSNWGQRGNQVGGTSGTNPKKTSGTDTESAIEKKNDGKPNANNGSSNGNSNEIGNGTNFDYFTEDDEVRKEFSITELITLSFAKDFTELEEELNYYGWVDCFTFEDIERIFRVAQKVSYQYGDMVRVERDEM